MKACFRDDADLAQRLRSRDPHVMRALYDRYGRAAYSVIFRVVREVAAAEDLLQETFLHLWNRSALLDPEPGSLGPWILAVARNRAVEHLRSSGARTGLGRPDRDRISDPRLFSALQDSAIAEDRAGRLKEALASLAPGQREVIELAYYEGLSQPEMAERLKQPFGTVQRLMRTALQTLRERLPRAASA